MRTTTSSRATLAALTLIILAAIALSGCPTHPQDGSGYGASHSSMMQSQPGAPAGGMGDGDQDRMHRPTQ